jgi:hypothetical protein
MGVPDRLIEETYRLFYSGHTDLAWALVEAAWEPGVAGKEKFLAEFRDRLQKSRYWPEIEASDLSRVGHLIIQSSPGRRTTCCE